ncbi:hypothetical protein [Mesorhizobium shangrilense]|uniref:Uncharacterized protein n=1 Tax=Mesorhizobium shangrilense TaxID=460060 RepID=A0ABV2DFZ1_9HYPH
MTVQEAAGRALSAIEPKLAQVNLDPEEKVALRTLYLLLGEAAANSPEQSEPEIGPLSEKVVTALSLNRDEGVSRIALLREVSESLKSLASSRNEHQTEAAQQRGEVARTKPPIPPRAHSTEAEQRDRYSQQNRQFSSAILVILAFASAFPFVMILLSSLLLLPAGGLEQIYPGELVKALATRPGNYGGTLQLMILPAAAALSVASFPWIFQTRSGSWLVAVSFAGMFAALVDGLIFGIAPGFDEATKGAITQYFVMNAGSIFIYIMLLIGLRVAALRQA